jgi:hypothetical protein
VPDANQPPSFPHLLHRSQHALHLRRDREHAQSILIVQHPSTVDALKRVPASLAREEVVLRVASRLVRGEEGTLTVEAEGGGAVGETVMLEEREDALVEVGGLGLRKISEKERGRVAAVSKEVVREILWALGADDQLSSR